jgi:ribA/ribD-fused uncharacterized protein
MKIEQTLQTKTHIYFWGSIFSNFHPIDFIHQNNKFANSEQAFMWRKAIFFKDFEIALKILNTTNPQEAKSLGRKVKYYDDIKWNQIREQIMYEVNIDKYKDEKLQGILLSTKNLIIVESSPVDKIWGVGLSKEDPRILDEKNWNGLNLLGKVLMRVREYYENRIN